MGAGVLYQRLSLRSLLESLVFGFAPVMVGRCPTMVKRLQCPHGISIVARIPASARTGSRACLVAAPEMPHAARGVQGLEETLDWVGMGDIQLCGAMVREVQSRVQAYVNLATPHGTVGGIEDGAP